MAEPKSAKVTLNAKTVAKIESKLRQALVNAGTTNIVADPVRRKGKIKVALDASALARFSEHLRAGMVRAESTNIAESKDADKATAKVK